MTDVSQQFSNSLKAGAAHVAGLLRDRIVKGEIAAGDRLIERQLSKELDVSRTPIREALKLLEADGLIEIPEEVSRVEPGDIVSYIPFSQFGIHGT